MIEHDVCINVDFRDGTIEGNFELGDVSRLDMAVVFETVARKLRDNADPVAFVNYDCGTVRIG